MKEEPLWKKIVTESLSGFVNGLLMFVFCYVFASLIFGPEDVGLHDKVPIGAGTNTISAFIVGMSFALYSDCPITIAGPDINPTIFFAQMAVKIREYVDLHYHDDRDERTLTTILFCIIFGSLLVGLTFYCLGRFRLTKIVQYVPGAVLSGFLASVGVIVMIKAVKACVGDELSHHLDMWQFYALLAPAIPIGVVLYLSKRFHWGSPIYMLPLCLFMPFALFYAAVYGTGNTLDTIRAQNLCADHNFTCSWLYDEFDKVLVIEQWAQSYGQTSMIAWGALGTVFPDMLVMLIIITLDSLLKISGTKKNLKISDLDYDHEMQLGGKANLFLVFMVGAPGYGQLKFNALNAGIIHNTDSRYPGIFSALFNGALFLAGFPLINYLPRFFVGGLLIYAGLGFVVENLIDTLFQNRLSMFEYLIVVSIVVLSQASSMLVAVVVGVMLSFVVFVVQYSKTGVVKAVLLGNDYQSAVLRSTQEDAKLEHLSSQVMIIKLKRYIFFGSANQITALVRDVLSDTLEEHEDDPYYYDEDHVSAFNVSNRINTIVFDFEDVYGIDYTACGTLMELISQLVEANQGMERYNRGLDDDTRSVGSRGSTRLMEFDVDLEQNYYEPPPEPSVWERNPILRGIRNQFRRYEKPPAKLRTYTIVFTGMNEKVYRRLKNEGIIDMIHLSGHMPDTRTAIKETVIPNILNAPKQRRLPKYLTSLFKKIPRRFRRKRNMKKARRSKTKKMPAQNKPEGKDLDPSATPSPGKDFLDDESQYHQYGDFDDNYNVEHDGDFFEHRSDGDNVDHLMYGGDSDLAGNIPTVSDYYVGAFPADCRRVFSTLDLGMEWVEDRLLKRASEIRRKWLVFFDSFCELHEQARLKAQHEPFEHILGGHLGDSVWKYIQAIKVPQGCYLCTAGNINPHLFLLQHGRLTSYMVRKADNSLVRIQSHRRGAFVNEDALFVDYPVTHTIIADEDSIVLALSRENLKEIEAHEPEIAFEIHRNVLRHTANVRNRLARELDVVDHWGLFERKGQEENHQYKVIDQIMRTQSFAVRSSYHPSSGQSVGRRTERSASYASSVNSGSNFGGLQTPSTDATSFLFHSSPGNSTVLASSESMQSPVVVKERNGGTPNKAAVQQSSHGPTPTPKGQGSHFSMTSKNVGRAILNQSQIHLKEEVARTELEQRRLQEKQEQGNDGSNSEVSPPQEKPRPHSHHGSENNNKVEMTRSRSSDDAEVDYGPKSTKSMSSSSSSKWSMIRSILPDLAKIVHHNGNSDNNNDNGGDDQDLPNAPSGLTRGVSGPADMDHPHRTSRHHKKRHSTPFLPHIEKMNGDGDDADENTDEEGENNDLYASRKSAPYISRTVSHARTDYRPTRSPTRDTNLSSIGFRPDLRPSKFYHPHIDAGSGGVGSLDGSKTMLAKPDIASTVDPNIVRKHLHLSQLQKVDAIACLRRAMTNRLHSRGQVIRDQRPDRFPSFSSTSPTNASSALMGLFTKTLPVERLRQTLMDMGHFPSDMELHQILQKHKCNQTEGVTEELFLNVVQDLSLETLDDDHIQGFALFFLKHAQTLESDHPDIPVLANQVLTVEGLQRFMEDLDHEEDSLRLEKFLAEWSDITIPASEPGKKPQRVLQFVGLCSMMAYHIKAEKLDEQVSEDFKKLTREHAIYELIAVEDILEMMRIRGEPCTEQDAEEMVFEADVSGNQAVSYDDLVETLTTVFESEIEPQLEQLTLDLMDISENADLKDISQVPGIQGEPPLPIV